MTARKLHNDAQPLSNSRQMNFNPYLDENFQISNTGLPGVDEEGDR